MSKNVDAGLERKDTKPKRLKLKERTLSNDIRYLGPLSYRYIRLIAWFFMAVSHIVVVLRINVTINPSMEPQFSALSNFMQFIGSMALPLFLLANFGIIIRRRDNFKYLLTFYGGMAALMFALANIVVIHYVFGIVNIISQNGIGDTPVMVSSVLMSMGSVGYVFNIFIDMFLCVLIVFFLFYKPKKVFVGNKIGWFRAMVAFPIIYELASLTIKQFAYLGFIGIPSYFFFLLTSKPPLTFAAFLLIALIMKLREVKYLKKHNNDEALLKEHYSTRAHSLRTSLTISVVFLLVAIADGIAIITYIVVYMINNGAAEATAEGVMQLIDDGYAMGASIGIGGSSGLILIIPFVLLYSYTRVHKNTKIDPFIPFIGIGLVAFVYVEGIYLTLRTKLADLLRMQDEVGNQMDNIPLESIRNKATKAISFLRSLY